GDGGRRGASGEGRGAEAGSAAGEGWAGTCMRQRIAARRRILLRDEAPLPRLPRRRSRPVSDRPRTAAERRGQAMALPPLREDDARAIARFLDAAWAERGLARASLEAYRRDLELLARWRDGAGGGLVGADREALFAYLAWRADQGYGPRSNARLRACLRAFYAHLVLAGIRRDDPAALIDPPRLPRPLPKAMSESQVAALLAAPDVSTPEGLRDRAMLELMYAAGLRVS